MNDTRDYAQGYDLAIRMMQREPEAGFKRQWHELAARCLLVASNPRNLEVSYPVALGKRAKDQP
jgi:hypothetical protein